jgi:hypothetical protein
LPYPLLLSFWLSCSCRISRHTIINIKQNIVFLVLGNEVTKLPDPCSSRTTVYDYDSGNLVSSCSATSKDRKCFGIIRGVVHTSLNKFILARLSHEPFPCVWQICPILLRHALLLRL